MGIYGGLGLAIMICGVSQSQTGGKCGADGAVHRYIRPGGCRDQGFATDVQYRVEASDQSSSGLARSHTKRTGHLKAHWW